MTTPHEPTHEATAYTPQDPTPQVPQAVYLPAMPTQQPVVADWVRDPSSGVPVRVVRPAPIVQPLQPEPTPERPRVDPVAQRLIAVGVAAPLVGWGGATFFAALAAATTGVAALAACLALVWLLRSSGGKQGSVNVNVKIDNRRRG